MRLFFALPLSNEIREDLYNALTGARKKFPRLKWVSCEALHVTLLFLGEVEAAELNILQARMTERQKIGGFEKFTLSYSGLSTFPLRGTPKVLYTPVTLGRDECISLHQAAIELSEGIKPPDRKKFIPHITLARIKERKLPEASLYTSSVDGSLTIDRMVLYESILGPKGPRYEERGIMYSNDGPSG